MRLCSNHKTSFPYSVHFSAEPSQAGIRFMLFTCLPWRVRKFTASQIKTAHPQLCTSHALRNNVAQGRALSTTLVLLCRILFSFTTGVQDECLNDSQRGSQQCQPVPSVRVYSDRMVEHNEMVLSSFSPSAQRQACLQHENKRVSLTSRVLSPQRRIGIHYYTTSHACSVRIFVRAKHRQSVQKQNCTLLSGSPHWHKLGRIPSDTQSLAEK